MHSAINKLNREISRHFDSYFSEFNLATSYVELLMIVHQKETVTQKEIAETLDLAPSTITRFINKLVKRGFIEKKRSGKTMMVSLRKGKMEEVTDLGKIYKRAESDLQKILGEKYTETTSKLIEYGIEQIQSVS
jgi:DNA-binding MarR family transcriptional regulator